MYNDGALTGIIVVAQVCPSQNCVIATATYGSPLAPEVQVLRGFRDQQLMKTYAGSNFMILFNAWYYSWSPPVARYENTNQPMRTVMMGALYPLIGIMSAASVAFSVLSPLSPEFAAVTVGIMASPLIGFFYLGLPLALVRIRIRRLAGLKKQRLLNSTLSTCLLGGLVMLVVGEAFASSLATMLAGATIVLSTTLLAATMTSAVVANRFTLHFSNPFESKKPRT